MSKPEVSTQAFGYTFTWAEEQVKAKVGLIRLHKAGNVTAEVEFNTTSDHWESGFLHRSHLNLSSSRSMKEAGKFLATRYDKDLLSEEAWGEIIEQLCYLTINLTRVGEEAHEIWPQGIDIPPPKYLLTPVLQENQVNLIFGEKESGKTQESILFCAVIGLPWHDNPFGFGVPDDPVRSLWLDWETDEQSFNYLYNELQRGMNMILPPIFYRHCKSSLPDDIEQVAHWVEQTGAGFIVVDHIGLAAGGPLNEDMTATAYFAAIRQLNVTSLHLSHQAKDPRTKKKTTFGSAFWENVPRTVWELKKLSSSDDTLDTVMQLRKRNIGMKPVPFGMRFTYNGDGTHVQRFDPNDMAEFVQETSARNRIYLLLQREGKMTTAAITEELGIKLNTVVQTLRRMITAQQVVKIDDEWGLLSKGDSVT